MLIPDGVTSTAPAPGIAVWHQHANNFALGKSEPAGLFGDPQHFTGVALAHEGYVVFCPDAGQSVCQPNVKISNSPKISEISGSVRAPYHRRSFALPVSAGHGNSGSTSTTVCPGGKDGYSAR